MWRKLVLCGVAAALVLCGTLNGAGASEKFPAFSSKTLDGNAVTQSVFAEKKLTMVNFWTTWCPPCIGEMPDLGNLGRSMPEDTQLIGIVLDAEDARTIRQAKDILKKARADFLQILPSEDMEDIVETVSAIPTTVFVDAGGRIVGEPLVGARSEKDYRAEIETALKSAR